MRSQTFSGLGGRISVLFVGSSVDEMMHICQYKCTNKILVTSLGNRVILLVQLS
jgi:hypothetical protein